MGDQEAKLLIPERIELLEQLQKKHLEKGNKGTVNYLYGRIKELEELCE